MADPRLAVNPVPPVAPLTDEQRDRIVDLIRDDPALGHVRAARMVGVQGSKGAIRQLLADDDLFQEARLEAWEDTLKAAGLAIRHLLEKLAGIVNDDGNPSQLRAIEKALQLRGLDQLADVVRHEHQHTGEVEVRNLELADAVDRFTAAVAAATVRQAAGGGAGKSARDALPAGES